MIEARAPLIGLVAASLLLCSAQSFQPGPKLYRAMPESVAECPYPIDAQLIK